MVLSTHFRRKFNTARTRRLARGKPRRQPSPLAAAPLTVEVFLLWTEQLLCGGLTDGLGQALSGQAVSGRIQPVGDRLALSGSHHLARERDGGQTTAWLQPSPDEGEGERRRRSERHGDADGLTDHSRDSME